MSETNGLSAQEAGLGIFERFLDGQHRDEERKKRQNASFDTEVGDCTCGGKIAYRSVWVIAVPSSEIRFGGENPMKEICRCSCVKCGLLYDHSHEPFRAAFRKLARLY
jgi:hypothetical protein